MNWLTNTENYQSVWSQKPNDYEVTDKNNNVSF